MTTVAETLSNLFDYHAAVANDSLYAPLTGLEYEICGVGVHLALVHDPPMYDESASPGTTYKYVNRINAVDVHSSAERGGLREGDIVIRVNDVNVDDDQTMYLPEDVADMIRGPNGTRVTISVDRDGDRLEYELVRAPIGKNSSSSSSSLTGANATSARTPSSPTSTMVSSIIGMITPEGVDKRALFDGFEDRTGIDLRSFF